jgi:hypothetical protein
MTWPLRTSALVKNTKVRARNLPNSKTIERGSHHIYLLQLNQWSIISVGAENLATSHRPFLNTVMTT